MLPKCSYSWQVPKLICSCLLTHWLLSVMREWYSSNSEVNASELLVNPKEIYIWAKSSEVQIFNHTIMCYSMRMAYDL